MNYLETILKQELQIKKIVTVHYFEFAKDYVFDGEKHDFWELLYVDKGEVSVTADVTEYSLNQGEMIFHKPNEFHNTIANGTVAPNVVVISFICKHKAINKLADKIFQVSDFEIDIMGKIISEAKNSYVSALDDPFLKKLERLKHPIFGSEQLIKIYLELLLIILIRKGNSCEDIQAISPITKRHSENDFINKIIDFLYRNIHKNISFDDVCKFSLQSHTNLKVRFKSATGMGIMEYYRHLKIEEIKKLIREQNLNFTKISEKMGYTSVHYFSRHFKKACGMTPSEYAASVKSKFSTNLDD